MKCALCLLAFLLWGNLHLAWGEPAVNAALESLADGFDQRRVEAMKPVGDLDDLYAENLERLRAAATSKGELQQVLAAKKELEGFREGPTPEAKDDFPEFQRLQSIYRKTRADRLATAQRTLGVITAEYREQLTFLKVNLTKQEKLEDAIAVEKVIEALDKGITEIPTRPIASPDGDPLAGSRDTAGEEADLSRPVKVFLLLGAENMIGHGRTTGEGPGSLGHATKQENLYPFLVKEDGKWVERKDVRNVSVNLGSKGMRVVHNEWMGITGRPIGPEIGIGHHLGNLLDEPVLLLKSCNGNRSLGWDLLPPGSARFEQGGRIYAGYKESPDSWKKGEKPKPIAWYAGKQYDFDIAAARKVLDDLDKYYPGAENYEVAGFFWWQGLKDSTDAVHASRYEENLVRLIKQLRIDFKAPDAAFVCATLGQTKKGAGGNQGALLNGTLAVDGESGKYPEFAGNVASVYSQPHCHGGSASGKYGGNAKTFVDVGLAMGAAMVELLKQ